MRLRLRLRQQTWTRVHANASVCSFSPSHQTNTGNSLVLPPGLSLNRCRIRTSGSESQVRESCKNVEELDLASNALVDLEEVYRIIRCMPNLRLLNLSHNDFSHVNDINRKLLQSSSSSSSSSSQQQQSQSGKENRDPQSGSPSTPTSSSADGQAITEDTSSVSSEAPEDSFIRRRNSKNSEDSHAVVMKTLPSIRSLVLNNTRIPWIAVDHLLHHMPNLSELHLSLNNYTRLDIPSKYPNVTRLYISGNPNLSHLDEISNLVAAFPCLEGLTMADCNVSNIPHDLQSSIPHLQSLNITNWPICECVCLCPWSVSTVDGRRWLPFLQQNLHKVTLCEVTFCLMSQESH